MNYYRARLLKGPDGKETGIWHYTCMNDGRIWPLGYCKQNNCQHTTPVEASNCYRKYINEQCNGMLPGGYKLAPPKDGDSENELVMSSSY